MDQFTLVILVQIVEQVQMGVLSAGDSEALSSIERPAFS